MKINQKQRLAALFVSFSVIIIGGASLMSDLSLDYYAVMGTFKTLIPASIVLGGLGWVMGMMLDRPRKKAISGYNKLILQELVNGDNSNMITHEANINISDDFQDNTNNQEKESI